MLSFAKLTSFLVSFDLDLRIYTVSGLLPDRSQVSDGTLRACHCAIQRQGLLGRHNLASEDSRLSLMTFVFAVREESGSK